MPSRDSPRFGPTGTGAVRRAHSSDRLDGARVTEVVAHQPLDALLRLRARIPEHVRRLLLQLVAEHVLVAAGFEVQDRSHAQQEILRVLEPAGSAGPRRSSSGSVSSAMVRAAIRSRSAPGASFTSGSSWYSVALNLRVALLDQLQQRPHDVGMRRRRVEHRAEPLEQLHAAPATSRASSSASRNSGLSVSRSANSSSSRTWWPTTTPRSQSGCRNAAQEPLLRRPDAPAEQHQQVDVGMQAEVPPAVAAERDDRHRPLRRAGVAIELPQQSRRRGPHGARAPRGRPPRARFRAQLVARRVESRPGCGAGAGPGCVIDMGRTSPGRQHGGVITGMATTAIIVGIPA